MSKNARAVLDEMNKRERERLRDMMRFHFSSYDASWAPATVKRLELMGLATEVYQRGERQVRDVTPLGREVAALLATEDTRRTTF